MDDILENIKLNAIEGIEPDFNPIRPLRHPHHTSTTASIFGGLDKLIMRLFVL